jgi:hypothetical protein
VPRADNAAKLSIKVKRETPAQALQPFTDYFKGFERVGAIRKVFGDETEEVLARLKIGFISNRRMYMGIRDRDGNISVGTYHLRHSPTRTLYLDVVHELFHIKQWMRDKKWFTKEHEKFMGNFALYYKSPIEVPAYEHTVREAERLGMSPEEIVEYLKMLPTSPTTWKQFLKKMGVEPGADPKPRGDGPRNERLQVRINRDPKLELLRFVDYFEGFDDAVPVKALFGKDAKKALKTIKVEFLESPFGSIYPSEEDGHLVVNRRFLEDADMEAIYLDVILCLSFIQKSAKVGPRSDSDELDFGESPVVLEAYKAMVKEARRIGTSDAKIRERLQLPRFMMTDAAFRKFASAIGVKSGD